MITINDDGGGVLSCKFQTMSDAFPSTITKTNRFILFQCMRVCSFCFLNFRDYFTDYVLPLRKLSNFLMFLFFLLMRLFTQACLCITYFSLKTLCWRRNSASAASCKTCVKTGIDDKAKLCNIS